MPEEYDELDWRTKPAEAYKKYLDFYKLLAAAVLVITLILLAREGYKSYPSKEAFDLNLTTEILGIAVTVLIINWFSDRRAVRQRQKQLIDEAASHTNDVARNAIHQISRNGWLRGKNGILQGQDLRGANLDNARLEGANLKNTRLNGVNLRGAYLNSADLTGACLVGADLENANLKYSSLSEANLEQTNLQGASLWGVNFAKADLFEANIEGVQTWKTYFHFDTRMPDGSYWTRDLDVSRFTWSGHPNFWRSGWGLSPAYSGGKQHWLEHTHIVEARLDT